MTITFIPSKLSPFESLFTFDDIRLVTPLPTYKSFYTIPEFHSWLRETLKVLDPVYIRSDSCEHCYNPHQHNFPGIWSTISVDGVFVGWCCYNPT